MRRSPGGSLAPFPELRRLGERWEEAGRELIEEEGRKGPERGGASLGVSGRGLRKPC